MATDRLATVTTVVLDVNETLSDMSAVATALHETGCGDVDFDAWFSGVLRDGFALAATDSFAAFGDVVRGRLHEELLRAGCDRADVPAVTESVLATIRGLPLHEDVAPALTALRGAGRRLVTLTNGPAAMTEELFARAGLLDVLDARLSVDQAGRWKPHADAYAHAQRTLAAAPAELALLSCHPWDVHGAVAFGWAGIWVNRHGARYPGYFAAPHLEVTDLRDLPAAFGRAGSSERPRTSGQASTSERDSP